MQHLARQNDQPADTAHRAPQARSVELTLVPKSSTDKYSTGSTIDRLTHRLQDAGPDRNSGTELSSADVPDTMAMMTDHLVAVRDHRDRAAFNALFAFFAPRIRRYLARQFPGTVELDDITQEIMILVWRRTGTFDAARASASTWIFAVARNYRIDLLRRRNKSLVPVDALPDLLVEPSPEVQVSMVERERLMRAALVQLPDHLRKLLTLMYFEGLHHREIAASTGLPIGTVKSRIASAYRVLQKALVGEARPKREACVLRISTGR